MNNKLNALIVATSVIAASGSFAQDSKITGSLSLDLNSNFISYGTAVWDASDDLTSQLTFNPTLSVNYQYNKALSFNGGIWLDWNDNATQQIEVVETDVWIGAAYTSGITTYSATFQNWQYAGLSEEILDLGVSFDTIFSPSLTIHQRLGSGASGGQEGTFLVASASHGFDLNDKVSFSIPVSVAFALTEDYHNAAGADSGFGYATVGLQGSYALTSSTALNFGLTYYVTEDDVTFNSTQGGEDNFLTWNVGYSLSF